MMNITVIFMEQTSLLHSYTCCPPAGGQVSLTSAFRNAIRDCAAVPNWFIGLTH